MKNPARVAELLAELREHADNDFERHRIDVLERDLTAPPVVEVIDETHQRFDGFNYGTLPSLRGYFQGVRPLHRVVWTYYYGEIPDGYQIHHVDTNKDNNDISNLQAMTASEHRKLHNATLPLKEYTCETCGKVFTLSTNRKRVRFCSKECMSAAYSLPENSFELRQCAVCGKSFRALKNGNQYFCSRSCSAKHSAQAIKKYPMEKICPVCGKTFLVVAETSLKVCCSSECGRKHGAMKRTKYPREKICPVCNKIFSPVNYRSVCCSRSCAAKLREQKKQRPI